MNIFEEDIEQRFNTKVKKEEDLFDWFDNEVKFLMSESVIEKLKREQIYIDDPIFKTIFEGESMYRFYNEVTEEKKVYHVKNTSFWFFNNEEDNPLMMFWKADIERKRPKEKGVALLNYSVLTGFFDFKYESFFEDGTVSILKMIRSKNIKTILKSDYFAHTPEEGIYYLLEHDRKGKSWIVKKRLAETDFEDKTWLYFFKKNRAEDRMIYEYDDNGEHGYEMPENFTDQDIIAEIPWNFDEEDYED